MPRRCLQGLVAITAAGAALRFSTLDLQSFAHDEAGTVLLTRMGLVDMLDAIPGHDTTPPLYFIAAWLWTRLAGEGEVGLRSLSALFGTATIPLAYAAAARLCSRRVGLGVAALCAFNPFLLWYSQEGRSYALVVLLTTLSLYLLARRRLGWWALASALALATHYFAVFVVVPEAVWLIYSEPSRRRAVVAAGGMTAAGLALLPLALHQRSVGFGHFISETGLGLRVLRTAKELLIGFDIPAELLLAPLAAAIALAGGLLALLRLREPAREGAWLAGAIAAAAMAGAVLLALAGLDYLNERNMIVVWLPAAIFVAAGLVLAGGRAGLAGLVVLCAMGPLGVTGLLANPNWRRSDLRSTADAVGPAKRPTVVALTPGYNEEPFAIYRPDAVRLSSSGARVRNVVVALRSRPDPGELHPAGPPRPRAVHVPGFREVGRRAAETYTLIRLRAPRPVRVTPAMLEPIQTNGGEGISLFLQRPG